MENEIIKLELTLGQINHILAVLGEASFIKASDPVSWIREQAVPQHEEISKKYLAQDAEENSEVA